MNKHASGLPDMDIQRTRVGLNATAAPIRATRCRREAVGCGSAQRSERCWSNLSRRDAQAGGGYGISVWQVPR